MLDRRHHAVLRLPHWSSRRGSVFAFGIRQWRLGRAFEVPRPQFEDAEIGHRIDVADGARVWRCDDASSARLQRGAGLLRIFAESELDMALRSRVPMDPTPQGR